MNKSRENKTLISSILVKLQKIQQKGNPIILCWIPSDMDVQGNEIVDLALKPQLNVLVYKYW